MRERERAREGGRGGYRCTDRERKKKREGGGLITTQGMKQAAVRE